jgi:T5SS/PEP-CTERM-associated repeat protein
MTSSYLANAARVARHFAVKGALSLLALAAASPLCADVIGIGDILPFEIVEGEEVPKLPQFGGEVTDNGGVIEVGGTDENVGGTAAGQMTIDIPSDTDPLESVRGIIGGNVFGLGLVRIVSLNSEWRIDEDLIIGDEGQGFLELTAGARLGTGFAGTPAADDFDLIMGNLEGSQGFVVIDGFASLMVNTNAAIGNQSFGSIRVLNRARLETLVSASLGTATTATGEGYVLVDGLGSRWNVGLVGPGPVPLPPNANIEDNDLIVGEFGRGTVEIRNEGRVRVADETFLGFEPRSHGEAVVTGRNSSLWTFGDMQIGNAAGTSSGKVRIVDNGLVRTDGATNIGPRGILELAAGGTYVTTPGTTIPVITNNGVIRGDGTIDGPVVNDGEIRNAAGLANQRERLLFTGPVTNNDNIELVGGEMEFDGPVTNVGPDGDIVAIDAILRFNGGLVNTGNVILEDSLVWSPGTFTSSANLVAESQSTVVGNLALTGSNTFHVTLGESDFSRIELTGNATLGGGVQVTLGDGYLPQIGDAFEIIDTDPDGFLSGVVSGTFAAVTGGNAGPGFWQASYTPTSAILSYLDDSLNTLNADFDSDGDVDGSDFLTWQRGLGTTTGATLAQGDANGDGAVNGADLAVWKGTFATSTAAAAAAASAVPEPAAWALALAALGLLPVRRDRRPRI